MTAAGALAAWGLSLRLDDVPSAARQAATLHLLDGVGCAIAGHRSGEVAPAVEVAARWEAPTESTVLGDGRRLPAPAAALANGALVHALDFDDTHAGGLVHATAAVLPTAFAVGEEVGAGGEDVLTAAIVGYEAVCRIAAASPHGFHARGFHATSVCGVFASALIAARLYGLDEQAAVHALGIAGSSAAGSLEFLHTTASTKQLHPGLAAQAGIGAARLAAAGATGPASILEGEAGLYRTHAAREVAPSAIVAGLGDLWEVTRIDLKPFPACQLSHATMHAAAAARDEIGPLEDVTRIEITLPTESVPIVAEPAAAKRRPTTPYEAKFSVQWSTAAMLVDGEVGVDTYDPDRLGRSDVAALADRIDVVGTPADVVAADVPGRLRIERAGAGPLEVEVAAHAGVGPDTATSKFRANGGSSAIADALLALEHLDAAGLARTLAATAGSPRTPATPTQRPE